MVAFSSLTPPRDPSNILRRRSACSLLSEARRASTYTRIGDPRSFLAPRNYICSFFSPCPILHPSHAYLEGTVQKQGRASVVMGCATISNLRPPGHPDEIIQLPFADIPFHYLTVSDRTWGFRVCCWRLEVVDRGMDHSCRKAAFGTNARSMRPLASRRAPCRHEVADYVRSHGLRLRTGSLARDSTRETGTVWLVLRRWFAGVMIRRWGNPRVASC